jgi:predicted NodU family carbamoyl transferase
MDAIIPILPSTKFCPLPGKTRQDVDVAGFSRCEFPTIFYRNIRGVRWIREKYRKYVERRTRRHMPKEFLRYHTRNIDDIFKVDKFWRASGFRDDTKMVFYNHHEAHALAPLFYSDWDEALLVTADAGGDAVNYSHCYLANGALAAVVHVDGTARPQIIEHETNPLYYDILDAFERESGLPVLVNTSFNVHEEPIVNKPSECIRALLDGRIDFVEFPRSPANAKGRSVDLVGLVHLDPA